VGFLKEEARPYGGDAEGRSAEFPPVAVTEAFAQEPFRPVVELCGVTNHELQANAPYLPNAAAELIAAADGATAGAGAAGDAEVTE
jgi:hypothetical protein